MKYAIVLLVCGMGLSAFACGGQEKPPLSADDLVDADSGVDQPAQSATAASATTAAPTAAPSSSAKK